MDNQKLFDLLSNVEEDINVEMREKFENSKLHKKFETLLELTIFDDELDDKIIGKIDILTDNMDKLNFDDAKKDIAELKEILKE